MSIRALVLIASLMVIPCDYVAAQATVRVAATILPAARLGPGPSMSVASAVGQPEVRIDARPTAASSSLIYAVEVLDDGAQEDAAAPGVAARGFVLRSGSGPAERAGGAVRAGTSPGAMARVTDAALVTTRAEAESAASSAHASVRCRAAACSVRPLSGSGNAAVWVRWVVVPNF